MKGTLRILTVLAAILALTGAVMAQTPPADEVQTRNIQAGTVNDPGSQLLYIADTGINLRTTGENVLTDTVADLKFGGAAPVDGEVLTNFISITNTHPTKAVTIHFRYYNDVCTDVLDFLVVLTCSDTLLMNPFNFDIPEAQLEGQQVNASDRIFGPSISSNFPALQANQFQSGRFIVLATAAGTVRLEGNETTSSGGFDDAEFDAEVDGANILFPSELAGTDCNFSDSGSFAPDGGRNVGAGGGFSVDNLHVFNASAVSFNHLIGHHTIAIPKAFIPDAGDTDAFLAVGVNAYTRPAVDLTSDPNSDGDGPALPDYCLLAGGEILFDSTTRCQLDGSGTPAGGGSCDSAALAANDYYLRSEIHGGTISGTTNASSVEYGALAWTSLHGLNDPPNGTGLEGQRVEFVSVFDDYNGNTNAGFFNLNGVITEDQAYAIRGAETVYIVQLYDNNEDQLTLTGEEPIIISPAPTVPQTANMRIIVDCLQVWINGNRTTANQTDGGLSIQDLTFVDAVEDGGPGFPNPYDGVLSAVNPLDDASQGWIRFVRDNNNGGTDLDGNQRDDDDVQASFVTIGQVLLKFQGFGASWWLAQSTQDVAISDADVNDPTPVTLEAQ